MLATGVMSYEKLKVKPSESVVLIVFTGPHSKSV